MQDWLTGSGLGSATTIGEPRNHPLPSIHGHDHFSMSGCVRHGRQIKASRVSLYANLGFTSEVCGPFLQVWQLNDMGWWKVYGMKQSSSILHQSLQIRLIFYPTLCSLVVNAVSR